MAKKKPEHVMWALWNYNRVMGVEPTRKRCREYANSLCCGGKEEADRMFKEGSFHTTKVAVREI